MTSNPEVMAASLLAVRNGAPPVERAPTDDMALAYRVQAFHSAALEGPAIGYKIGCTNPAVQKTLGIDEPFFGRMHARTTFESPLELPASAFRMRVVEPEYAFRMAEDLPAAAAPYDPAAVSAAIAAVIPGIEIVDSRYRDWKSPSVGAVGLVADNGVHGAWVRGREFAWPTDHDLLDTPVVLYRGDEVMAEGDGRAVLGDPINALTWLANVLTQQGLSLKAGDFVTTGTCTTVYMAEAGDVVRADFGGLGEIRFSFT
ncbi:2-keto-4-pentenoate hydratase [Oceanibacterium hippocampi]|uniref:2-keto-4-pentenoate hydratase n=1 Tax=Oceanibacterium hippocampi TaxID=745714 RepID=A0A1Y5TWW0_9PROT|nr:fumarylacetoacetate hydrolase family protein [Oceanibacterium hippocampi]SLN74329.1 2-keto-4-pentenoate hydratase [Oceanibacterium hippocampi]